MPASPPEPPGADDALLALLEAARAAGYRFVTVTPETHRRVIARAPGATARDLRGVFGWSLPFEKGLLPAAMWDALDEAGMLAAEGALWKSRLRISSIDDRLFLHSAFPTEGRDSVFLGPDSYRFVRFLRAELPGLGPIGRLVDIGAGAGVGAIMAAALAPGARLTLTDINPPALQLARINARHAGLTVETIETAGLTGVAGPVDLVIANPPFIADAAGRAYRDGGGPHGAGLSLDWAVEAAGRLEPGGTMLLYTGSAIVAGRDALREALADRLGDLVNRIDYCEIDPDIFGEQVGEPGYEDVERIAAVGIVIRKR